MDRSELFLHPVSKEEVPDYYDVIKEPMTWTQIEEKLDKMMYLTTEAFKVCGRYLAAMYLIPSATLFSSLTTL